MAYTQTDLDNVERAIIALASGTRAIKFVIDGDVVSYNAVELPQLRALRNELVTEINEADTTGGSLSMLVIHGSKGL